MSDPKVKARQSAASIAMRIMVQSIISNVNFVYLSIYTKISLTRLVKGLVTI